MRTTVETTTTPCIDCGKAVHFVVKYDDGTSDDASKIRCTKCGFANVMAK